MTAELRNLAVDAPPTIDARVRGRAPLCRVPLYERVLDDAWHRLAPPIRRLHSVTSTSTFIGTCDVERGRHPIARLLATVVGFPDAGTGQTMRVTLAVEGRDGERERWTRRCGTRSFASVQYAGTCRSQRLVRERFGPVAVDMALVVDGADLRYVVRRWSLFGVAMPLFLGPRTTASETLDDGRFHFDVELRHPFVGRIVRYRGTLVEATA